MAQNKPKIMYDSPEAAQFKTFQGWVSSNGRYFGKDPSAENVARYDGSTHRICADCGAEYETRAYCSLCASKRRIKLFEAMPFKEWNGSTPLCLFDDDEYFFDEDDIINYVEEHECSYNDLRLQICEPNIPRYIEDDHWSDDLPEDLYVEDVCPELHNLVQKVNNYIKEHRPVFSWRGGKYRTEFKGPQS